MSSVENFDLEGSGIEVEKNTEEPEVYFLEDLTLEDRFKLYSEEILGNVLCSEVDKALVQYVVANVEPVGWKAIWRSTPYSTRLQFNCDFLVQVKDVSQKKLESDVEVLSLLPSTDFELVSNHQDDIAEIFQIRKFTAPLIELYPIYVVDSEDFEKTAISIENVRFFYEHLWQPWDNNDEEDYIFVEKHLRNRLKFYYDVQNGTVSYQTAFRLRQVLKDAKEIFNKIEQAQDEMNVSDSESDLKEADLIQCLQLNQRLEELQREAQLLENPQLAMFVPNHCGSKIHSPRSARESGSSVYHIVAKGFTVKMLKTVLTDLPDDATVEFYKSFESAIVKCYEGDVILLQPGNYRCRALDWLENSVTIKGMGKTPEETVISSIENEGIFINCKATSLEFSNVKILASKSMACGLMVHHGLTTITNCFIAGGNIAVIAINGADLKITNSVISTTKFVGIDLRSGCSAYLDKNTVSSCGLAGIILQIDDNSLKQIMTLPSLSIREITFKNINYAIVVSVMDSFNYNKNLCFEEDEKFYQWLEDKKILNTNLISGTIKNKFSILSESGESFMKESIMSIVTNHI